MASSFLIGDSEDGVQVGIRVLGVNFRYRCASVVVLEGRRCRRLHRGGTESGGWGGGERKRALTYLRWRALVLLRDVPLPTPPWPAGSGTPCACTRARPGRASRGLISRPGGRRRRRGRGPGRTIGGPVSIAVSIRNVSGELHAGSRRPGGDGRAAAGWVSVR